MKDGILNINKPQNMTSFDVVAILRKKLGVKKIGHLGTLDPMAEGVLPVAIGKATRVMDYLSGEMKEYIAEFIFGISTDTDDIWGKPLEYIESEKEISLTDIEESIKKFTGVIEQIPPRYAAIKVDGKKLYEYAREGKDVDVKSRSVYIPEINIIDFGKRKVPELESKEFTFVSLKILCSKGTYIRSIARDMGTALGSLGVMSGLIRTRNGDFTLKDALPLDDARKMENEDIYARLTSTDMALSSFPKIYIGEWEASLFKNGVKLEPNEWKKPDDDNMRKGFPLELPDDYYRTYRVYGESFLGLGVEMDDGSLKVKKVFV